MIIKKTNLVLLFAVFVLIISCAQKEKVISLPKNLSPLDKKAFSYYGLSAKEIEDGVNISSMHFTESEKQIASEWNESFNSLLNIPLEKNITNYHAVSSLTTALMELKANKVDFVPLPEFCSMYIADHNLEFSYLDDPVYAFDLCMYVNNIEDRDSINNIIKDMKADGTLSAMQIEYLIADDVSSKKSVNTVKLKNGNPRTLKVGITGDYPPYDYVNLDGNAMGYNIAFMEELTKRLSVDIELVNIESGALFSALAGGRIDIFFCYTVEGYYEGDGSFVNGNWAWDDGKTYQERNYTIADNYDFGKSPYITESYSRSTYTVLLKKEKAELGKLARKAK